ncbi:uncharacterized protein LOC120698037 [Panicum virgatum]|uniref:uncharacterized protein LOC120698037 n=1 Tax=Panicum virgatum TaxID=38727 RepID=UPI0019D504DE|nr:uncharacterized protein LOC120698037 [Panicum virgatum]
MFPQSCQSSWRMECACLAWVEMLGGKGWSSKLESLSCSGSCSVSRVCGTRRKYKRMPYQSNRHTLHHGYANMFFNPLIPLDSGGDTSILASLHLGSACEKATSGCLP